MTSKQQRTILIFAGTVFIFIIVFFGIRPIIQASNEGKNRNQTVYQEIPDAEEYSNPQNKRTGYRNGSGGRYFDSLAEGAGDDGDAKGERPGGSRERPKEVTVEDVFKPEERPAYNESDHNSKSIGSSGETSRRKKPSEKPGTTVSPSPGMSTSADENPPEKKDTAASQSRPQIKRSGAVSSLDEDVSSDLGNGFSTLDGRDAWVENEESKPYRCMFTRSEKVSSGQRITVRLLEDLVIGDTHIPQNTHLQGVCKISERMEVSLTSLDMGGKILTFHFEAYDTDGQKGIYCSDLRSEAQEITNKGVALGSSSLNKKLNGAAREIANIGASMVRNNLGEISVSIPSGYMFYIIEEKK